MKSPVIYRFVAGTGLVSRAIIAQEKTSMPITPSHVEVLTEDGSHYIGAHLDGGVQARPVGYDKGQFSAELLLPLTTTPAQDRIIYDFMTSRIGEPYDWQAILGFIVPEHFHVPNHVICSALATLAARKSQWLPWPVAAPAHLISPRDLLLIISGRMQVPGI